MVDESAEFITFEEKCDQNLDYHNFSWPDSLKTNSQRLIHHAELKMFPNAGMDISIPLERYISSNRELDLMLETFKHYEIIR